MLCSPVHGSDIFFQNTVTKQIDKVLDIQSHLNDIDNPQVELHLLRSCLSVCKVHHLLRTVTPGLADSEFSRFDRGLRQSLEVITHSSIPDSSWLQATLPVGTGGLGLREALTSSAAAFIGSCNTTQKLIQSLLRNAGNSNTKFAEEVFCPDFQVQDKYEAYSIFGKKLPAMHNLNRIFRNRYITMFSTP